MNFQYVGNFTFFDDDGKAYKFPNKDYEECFIEDVCDDRSIDVSYISPPSCLACGTTYGYITPDKDDVADSAEECFYPKCICSGENLRKSMQESILMQSLHLSCYQVLSDVVGFLDSIDMKVDVQEIDVVLASERRGITFIEMLKLSSTDYYFEIIKSGIDRKLKEQGVFVNFSRVEEKCLA